jgi:hypothetical protein
MIQDIKELMKLDRISIFIILFWTIIFSSIIYMSVGLALPDMGKVFIGGLFTAYGLWKVYVSGLKSQGILKSITMIVLFYLLGAFMAYISIGLMILPFRGIVDESPWIAWVMFIGAMISPYLMLGVSAVSKEYRISLNQKRERIRVGLSTSTAMVTIFYALCPFLTYDPFIIETLQVAFFVPFSINILGICMIEYVKLAENEAKVINNYEV